MSTTEDTKKKLEATDLDQFTGTENWYKHWLAKCTFTDGVKFLAEQAGAFWLIDEVAIGQTRPKVRGEEFQVWILDVDLKHKRGTLRCEDGNDHVIFTKAIPFTDSTAPTARSCCHRNTKEASS
jgi:hypothetical protein